MGRSTSIIEILLVDDHPLFCDGLRTFIKKKLSGEGLSIVGTVHNGHDLLKTLEDLQPDIILMDIQMPEMDGIQATSIVTKQFPEIKVIALSTFNDFWAVAHMVKAGVKGYLMKNVGKEELLQAVTVVHQGGEYYTPEIAKHLDGISQLKVNVNDDDILSEREKEVIRLLCHGKTNKEIASALFISKRTVEGHRDKISHKINAKHSMEIMQYAIKHGIYKV